MVQSAARRVRAVGVAGVVLADDHVMFTELLARDLARYDDIKVLGTAEDAATLLALCVDTAADVVVLDYSLTDADGVSIATALQDAAPDLRIVFLTGVDHDSVLHGAIAVGCVGYVTKFQGAGSIVAAIRTVRDGGLALDGHTLERLRTEPRRMSRPFGLTQRELAVLHQLADGASTQELADRMFISLTTARNHVQRVIRKVGAHSRLEAVVIAARAGLIPIGGAVASPTAPRTRARTARTA